MGIDMIKGGGKLLIGSGGRYVGAGHFGLIDLGQGVQKFSMHWEADLDRGGASVIDIRPLLWKDGWPVAGESIKEGTYEIESARTGTALEMAVEGVPVGGARRGGGAPGGGRGPGAGAAPGAGAGRGAQGAPGAGAPPAGAPAAGARGAQGGAQAAAGGRGPGGPPAGAGAPGAGGGRGMGGGGMFGGTGSPIPAQDAAQVSSNWPSGNLPARMSNYLLQAQQKWTIAPAPNAGGYPGAPYYKITVAGTNRALAATAEGELTVLASFTGAPEQLWRIDQLADGSYRIMPKAVPNSQEAMALSAIGASFPTLSKFDPKSDKYRWLIKQP
jgi:arabinan endo-1,5-alpha-L-arabinosidase